MSLKIISAGAGSGKTYRLTQEMVKLLKLDVQASGIIATTFTAKAAAELQERVRTKLLEDGLTREANDLSNALIGTVHGLGVKLLKRFAFEAGVSPNVDIIADEDQQVLFNQSLAMVLKAPLVEQMEHLCDRLGLNKKGAYDWRSEVKRLTETARANAFTAVQLAESKQKSFEAFEAYLERPSKRSLAAYNVQLTASIQETIAVLESNEDTTKVTKNAVQTLRGMLRDMDLKGGLYWYELAKIMKLKVSKKSTDDVIALKELATEHERLPAFRTDIKAYIDLLFDMVTAAIDEFDRYKKQRGLIDYTDMEVYINHLLDHPQVKEVLRQELDLLMVDEFQDTSPIQLEIFLKLSNLARYSVWVGDPKQSIYGFRGAEPELMQAIIASKGGVHPDDIQEFSWRSRKDIVHSTNAIFCKAFQKIPPEQVALKPMRTQVDPPEPIEANHALMHWHYEYEGKGRTTNTWFDNCIATSIRKLLQEEALYILPKGEKKWRKAKAGDVAILCRSNKACTDMAEALHRTGLQAAVARSGLMNTAEAKLILACMKYILTRNDTLSVAEILLLATKVPIEHIIEDRLKYLKAKDEGGVTRAWAADQPYVRELDELREQVRELSSSEILNLLLEELDLRRIIAAWGNVQQRLDNVDVLRKMSIDYEDRCNRLHSAASLGGFLLWLTEIENAGEDKQSSGESTEAVNVLTYHRSKGLEYPILICHSMEQNLRADVWGIEIVNERTEVDLEDVLGGRWLRYWVNPYADQSKGTPLIERLNGGEAQKRSHVAALEEEARLLYVGITRARDYLIFVSRAGKPTKWLNRVWHEGQEDYPTLEAGSNETPWIWEDQPLYCEPQTEIFPKDFPSHDLKLPEIEYIEAPSGKTIHDLYQIDLRREDWKSNYTAHTARTVSYAADLPLAEEHRGQVAKALKAFLVADYISYAEKERQQMADNYATRYDLENRINTDKLLLQSGSFYSYLYQSYSIQLHYRKYPLRAHVKQRLFQTVLDLVLETPSQIIVVQHSGFTGDAKRYRRHALDVLGAWSFLTKCALQQAFSGKTIEIWVHFVLGGELLELQTKVPEPQQMDLF
ncbi:MAG: UvrD-helicase domain-containing protein [Bacteroidota bacterium]